MTDALKNYSTTVPVTRTLGEISDMLVRAGATDVLTSYMPERRVSAIKFLLPTPYGQQLFALPAKADAVYAVLARQKAQGRNRAGVPVTRDQAERVAWRIIRDWLDAQLALIETEQATADQVLLPYRLIDADRTVYDAVVAQQGVLPTGMRLALLPEGRA